MLCIQETFDGSNFDRLKFFIAQKESRVLILCIIHVIKMTYISKKKINYIFFHCPFDTLSFFLWLVLFIFKTQLYIKKHLNVMQ